jgi:hypothetical protein
MPCICTIIYESKIFLRGKIGFKSLPNARGDRQEKKCPKIKDVVSHWRLSTHNDASNCRTTTDQDFVFFLDECQFFRRKSPTRVFITLTPGVIFIDQFWTSLREKHFTGPTVSLWSFLLVDAAGKYKILFNIELLSIVNFRRYYVI